MKVNESMLTFSDVTSVATVRGNFNLSLLRVQELAYGSKETLAMDVGV